MIQGQIRFAEVDPDTGYFVTKEEAYLPEEWDELRNSCLMCKREFVIYYEGDEYPRSGGRVPLYCSDLCRKRAHNEQSRLAMMKTRTASRG